MASKKMFYEGVATLMGMTIGAGILGIPYVVAQSGFLIGALIILLVGFVILIVNLCVGEICLRTKGNHQLTGYAEKYLGFWGKFFMLISFIIGFYGALIAYIIGEGQALGAIFNYNPFLFSIIFFIIMTVLLYFGIKTMGASELVLIITKICLFVVIAIAAFFVIKLENIATINLSQIFLPYGVVLFAYMGAAAIPEMKEEMFGQEKNIKKAILIGVGLITLIYLFFALIVVGVSGKDVAEVATVGLAKFLGYKMLVLGNLFAVIAMATSYIAVGYALKETFYYDLKLDRFFAWFLGSFVALAVFLFLYIFDLMSFVSVVGLSGAIAGSISFIIIMLIHQKAKKMGDKVPEYSLNLSKTQTFLIICFFLFATVVYLWRFF